MGVSKAAFLPVLIVSTLIAAGCSLAPDYVRPAAPVPGTLGSPGEPGARLPPWEEFFPEPRLRALLGIALGNNRDLRLAALRVLEARAGFGLARAGRLPMVEGEVGWERSGGPRRMTEESYEAALALPAFEIDYLNRLGDLSRAALETYLGTAEAGRYARITLMSGVAGAYLESRLAAERVGLTRRNLQSFRASRAFVEERLRSGQADLLELEQARGLVAFAEAELEARKAELVLAENALAFWVGDFGGPELPGATALLKWPELRLPEGVPSETLLARPDIREAEHALRAANANVGAARAAFFPSISLTGSLGAMGADFSSLVGAGGGLWSFGPRITIPIFNAGRNRANLDLAEVRKDIAVATYEKAIQSAFREVADAMGQKASLTRRLKAQANYLAIQRRVLELANNRYQNGTIGYLDVLEAQRSVLEAELSLVAIQKERIANDVALFAYLGGGFPADPPETAGPRPAPILAE
ncbi:MAG: efflux transporter outer membrane subunit [Deltaproteobacteria bacterium]|jgi:NodT family efflux transporter outer membrane factor (OMF) lipoprotein|nr:efflux transporter outer membrane subunit [Deltaproteobacteria bacterium]